MRDVPALVLAVGGPTASGKTALALHLSALLNGEIVNADSRQIYRLMDIGTAKPTLEQRAVVPHHLIDVVLPSEEFTLAQFVCKAHDAIEAIRARGKLPIVVGGTGLYLRALLQGYAVPAVPPNETLRRDLEALAASRGRAALLDRLQAVDPLSAARIDGRNIRRVIRAIEVTETLGVPFAALQRKESAYRYLLIVLHGERAQLYARADARLQTMLEAGFEEEVAGLLSAGYSIDLPAFSALGYREFAAAHRGRLARAEAIEMTRRATHAFIRRQITWFKAEPEAVLLDMSRADLLRAVVSCVEQRLGVDTHETSLSE